MRIKISFLVLFIIVLPLSLLACSPAPQPDGAIHSENQTGNLLENSAVFTRDEAELLIRETTAGSDSVEIYSYPELDKSLDGVLYYFIQIVYPNKMSASYYVDSMSGTCYVAFGGELDTSNPLPSPDQSLSHDSDDFSAPMAQNIPEITVPESAALNALLGAIGYSKKEVEREFGKQHNNISVDYNGHMEAYLYIDRDVTFAFDLDGYVAYIYCSDSIDIGGATPGMNFSQIQDALGETDIIQTWVETPENTAYQIAYRIDERFLVFFSRQQSGEHAILSIH